jgi:phosphonate transport system substrate-binding protein
MRINKIMQLKDLKFPRANGRKNIQASGYLLIIFTIILSGCKAFPGSGKVSPTATPQPFSSPTPGPLGSANNPLVLGFVNPESDQKINDAGTLISQELTAYSLLSSRAEFYPDYASLLKDMSQGKTHIAWLPPATYLDAHQKGTASISLLSNHFGVFFYGTQFLANKASNFLPAYNPLTGTNTQDEKKTLEQFKDKRPCWVGTDSLSGYYVPLGILNENEIPVLPGAFLQNHPAVIRALYIRGICDFGVTFAHMGDPRTASVVQSDLTDAIDQIPVIYQSEAVIPNLGLAYSFLIPQEMRKQLDAFFLSLPGIDANQKTLSSALNYEIQGLQKVDDSIYDRLRKILDASGANLESLVGW